MEATPGFLNLHLRLMGLLVALLIVSSESASAHGILIGEQDAQAVARGNAFTATADNPSALYYNPAGITQLSGQQFRVGTYGLTYQTSYRSSVGAVSESQRAYEAVPQIYYTYSLRECPVSLGLGVFAPFGLSMKWPENTGFRQVAIEGRVQYLTVQPVIAWQVFGPERGVHAASTPEGQAGAEPVGDSTLKRAEARAPFTPSLSLAIGPSLNYARTDLQQGLSPFAGNDYFRFKGDAFSPGFSAGVRWQPLEQHAFGVTYRSATKMDYSGHTDTTSVAPAFALRQDARAEFEFPQSVTLGWSWRPAPEWNVEFNANWTDWSTFDSVPIRQATPVPALTLNWRSSRYFAWGVTRKFEGGWRASAGYIFSENSVPDGNFTPLVPDTDRHAGSIGLGRDTGRWSWDLA